MKFLLNKGKSLAIVVAARLKALTLENKQVENLKPIWVLCAYTKNLTGFNYMDTIYGVMGYDLAQIPTAMSSIKSSVDNGVKNFNDFVEKKYRCWLIL